MVDWVHCNSCYKQPNGSKKYFLTNCSHIYCEECVALGKEGGPHCKLCRRNCSTMQLSSQMRPDIQLYFTDPSDLLQKQLQEIVKVMNFQKDHRQRFASVNREKITKFSELLEEYGNVVKRYKESENENRLLREENTYLKRLLNQAKNQSPLSTAGSVGTPNSLFGRLAINASPGYPRVNSDLGYGNQVPSTISMPSPANNIPSGRLSIRTPPVNGRMGIIPGRSPSPYSGLSLPSTPLRSNTPTPQHSPSNRDCAQTPVNTCTSSASIPASSSSQIRLINYPHLTRTSSLSGGFQYQTSGNPHSSQSNPPSAQHSGSITLHNYLARPANICGTGTTT